MSDDITIQELFKTLLKDRILKKYRFNIQNNLNDFAFHLSSMEGKRVLDEKPLDRETVDELLDTIPETVDHDIILTINGYIFLAHLCLDGNTPELAQRPLNYALELSVKVFTENRGRSTQLETSERRELLDSMEPLVEGIVNFQATASGAQIEPITLYETFVEGGLMLVECARKTALEVGQTDAPGSEAAKTNDHERVFIDHNHNAYHRGVVLLSKGYALGKKHGIKPEKLNSFADHITSSIGRLLDPEHGPEKRKKNLETALAAAKNIEEKTLVSKITADLQS